MFLRFSTQCLFSALSSTLLWVRQSEQGNEDTYFLRCGEHICYLEAGCMLGQELEPLRDPGSVRGAGFRISTSPGSQSTDIL